MKWKLRNEVFAKLSQETIEKLTTLTDFDAETLEYTPFYVFAIENIINQQLLNNLETPIQLHNYRYKPQPFYDEGLFDYQNEAMKHIVGALKHPLFKGFVVNATMGAGKTYIALSFLRYFKPKNALIIATKTILENVWYPLLTELHLPNTIQTSTFQSLSKYQKQQWQLVIVDESHYLRNIRAQKTQNFLSLKKNFTLFLTGTPIVNHTGDIYIYAKTIYHRLPLPSYDVFIYHTMHTKPTLYTHLKPIRIRTDRKFAVKQLFNHMAFNITRETLQYPPTYITLYTLRLHRQLENETELEIEKAQHIIKQAINFKSVIIYKYRKTKDALLKFLKGKEIQVIDGETNNRKINNDVDMLLLSQNVSLEGIDLTAFETMFILTLPWSPALLQQLTSRLWRKNKENFQKPIYLIVTNHEVDKAKRIIHENKYEAVEVVLR